MTYVTKCVFEKNENLYWILWTNVWSTSLVNHAPRSLAHETWLQLITLHPDSGCIGKRTRNDAMNKRRNIKGSALHEIVVQKLSLEDDRKQTYSPIQHEEMALANLKSACVSHFNLPAGTCDILVSNKGPSCTNISQIPHWKDKVKCRKLTLFDIFYC